MSVQQTITDKTTTGVAAVAVTINWWLPWLKSASEVAALLVPIAGLCWLLLQIAFKIAAYYRDDDGRPRR